MNKAYTSPSLKTLKEVFKNYPIQDYQLMQVKACMTGKANSKKICENLASSGLIKREEVTYLDRAQRILFLFNFYSKGFGLETIGLKADEGNYTDFNGLEYVNHGDTYIATLIFNHKSQNFRACSWGDIVESNPSRYV